MEFNILIRSFKVDDFKPVNKNVDGIANGPKPVSQMNDYGTQGNYQQNNPELTDLGTVTPSSPINELPVTNQATDDANNNPTKKKPNKAIKVWLVVLTLLFIASAAFAVYEYFQIQDYKKKVNELTIQVEKLKAENYDLNYKTKDTSVTQDLVKKENETLKSKNSQLKAACGTACRDIN